MENEFISGWTTRPGGHSTIRPGYILTDSLGDTQKSRRNGWPIPTGSLWVVLALD